MEASSMGKLAGSMERMTPAIHKANQAISEHFLP